MRILPIAAAGAAFLSLPLCIGGCSAAPVTVISAPVQDDPARIQPSGTSVLPSGRTVTPAGDTVLITHKPYGLAVSPDGRTAVTLHETAVTVIDLMHLNNAVRLPSYDGKQPAVLEETGFMGAVYAPDGRLVYLSDENGGKLIIFDPVTLKRTGVININGAFGGQTFTDSLTGDLAISSDGKRLYVLDRANYRLVTIDTASRQVVGSVKVGRLPFGIGLSPDGRYAYVANVGLYEYPLVPGVTPTNGEAKMLSRPPYGIPSKAAEDGIDLEDGRRMPGLGSPLVPEAMSVWVVDTLAQVVTAKLKPGFQIGQVVGDTAIIGGSSPSGVAVGRKLAYVSNATNDTIAVIDRRSDTISGYITLPVHPLLDQYRGLNPFHLSLSPDERRLYVALLTLNAVAVIDTRSRSLLGYIPTGWSPTRTAVSGDGKTLYVTSARGLGAGPNGGLGFTAPPQGTYVGDIQLGSFQAITLPDADGLAAMTKQVVANTLRVSQVQDDGRNPVPPSIGQRKSPIKYVVYVTKENRTFDDVFGQFAGANGDPSLAGLGQIDLKTTDGQWLKGIQVSPNHQAIAKQWALSDNFFVDSDASVHGHRWMMNVTPNPWMESNTASSKDWKAFSPAPGRRFPGSSGGIDPEDYNERGGLWEQLQGHGISFRNFGQSNEFAGSPEEAFDTDSGLRMPVIFPMAKVVLDNTSQNYAGFNLNIPDQFRMDQFETEIRENYLSGKAAFPRFISIQIPNDHGADPRPADGYPYRQSYMADNDLALGRFVQFLSHTPYWKDMVVIILEDDPQGGVDHVDAHRSILMLAGPYVKRGYVSKTHANFGAVLKTMYHILDLPPVNQFDAAANLLSDFFTDTPDFTPYTAIAVNKTLFDPDIALAKYGKSFDWKSVPNGEAMDDEDRQRRQHPKPSDAPAQN